MVLLGIRSKAEMERSISRFERSFASIANPRVSNDSRTVFSQSPRGRRQSSPQMVSLTPIQDSRSRCYSNVYEEYGIKKTTSENIRQSKHVYKYSTAKESVFSEERKTEQRPKKEVEVTVSSAVSLTQ